MSDEPRTLFADSRRLTGPNLFFDRPAVVLSALGELADDAAAHAGWAERVIALCAALGWPAPQPIAHRHHSGSMLGFAAPEEALFTATEINEWAWERSAVEPGVALAQSMPDDAAEVAAEFARQAARERSPPLLRLKAAAAARGLPCCEDDDTLSIGCGAGSLSFPRAALPLPMDVSWGALHAIPTVLVTGSNGKTTTTRLLAAMAAAAGRCSGHSSTEGVVIGETQLLFGDYAGPAGARAVLRHPQVDFAVLETARGGLLRRGLAVRQAGAAVVTNVSADHFGEYGIDSIDDIAAVKLVVAHALGASGTLVLNADDPTLMRVAARTPHALAARLALFSLDHDAPPLRELRSRGGPTCGVRAGRLVLALADREHDLGAVDAMPLALDGVARFNIGNLGAAVLAAHAAGLPLAAIVATLSSFGANPQDNPGRLERWPHRGATVLIDYAHNPDGLAQLLGAARALKPARLGLLLGQAGNRDDAAIDALARTAAVFAPERVIVKELPLMLRGRAPGEVPTLLVRALLAAGLPASAIAREDDEGNAAELLLQWAEPGDAVVLPLHTAAVRARLSQRLSSQR